MSRTEHADYLFAVKEAADGTPWIMLELRGGSDLSILKDGFLGLGLPADTDIRKAEEIARYLRENIEEVSYTDLSDVP